MRTPIEKLPTESLRAFAQEIKDEMEKAQGHDYDDLYYELQAVNEEIKGREEE